MSPNDYQPILYGQTNVFNTKEIGHITLRKIKKMKKGIYELAMQRKLNKQALS